ncbi:MAG: hypothetical protein NZ703_10935 [Gemmataceae bacterium]|nr:hypothetical protein [Gemmataceae bacterium]MCS7271589.1 hypothetical protein [Gemmataceae bacterium]MDW8244048.1 hypothetical protein [Thermogemmata sp.]
MKRTATTLAFLAGLGSGCVSTEGPRPASAGGYNTVTYGRVVPGVVGPSGEPIIAARGVMPAGGSSSNSKASEVKPAGWFRSADACDSCARVPGANAPLFGPHFDKWSKVSASEVVPVASDPHKGILPAPGMGPPGAVAAVGALVPGMTPPGWMGMPPAAMGRTSIKFTGPTGMTITWQLADGRFSEQGLKAPAAYNFLQGQVYRLRLTNLGPEFVGDIFYPTLEVAPANPKTMTFLAHASVPVTFTAEDFQQAKTGNLVVKVIYLPDRENQEFAIAGAEELVSTRLPPGADPIVEAQSRGTILCIIRLGNIDLENKYSPAMNAPPMVTSPRPQPAGPSAPPLAPMPPVTEPKKTASGPSTNPSGVALPTPGDNLPTPAAPIAAPPGPLPPLPPKAPAATETKPQAPTNLPPLK